MHQGFSLSRSGSCVGVLSQHDGLAALGTSWSIGSERTKLSKF